MDKNLSLDKMPYEDCSKGIVTGVIKGQNGVLKRFCSKLWCNKWSCITCRKKLVKKLKKRMARGGITEFVNKNGFRTSKYAFKFLTLTYAGGEKRKKPIPEIYKELQKRWHDLRDNIKRKWGDYHYLRISEPHKDGIPHLHILIVGHAIAKKQVLQHIRDLWCNKYGLGNVDLEVIRNGLGGGINYAMKYATKAGEKFNLKNQFGDKSRIFTASKGALGPPIKINWVMLCIEIKDRSPIFRSIENFNADDVIWPTSDAFV